MNRLAVSSLPIAVILLAASVPAEPAQTQSGATATSTGQTTTQATQKVWTNDNIASVGGGVDDSQPTRTVTMATSRPKPATMRGRNVKWYRDQISALEARIQPIDAQIAELQSALDGKSAGDGKTSQRPRYAKIDQWPAELKDLQTRRQTIVDKIDVLRDEARHNGISPSTLP